MQLPKSWHCKFFIRVGSNTVHYNLRLQSRYFCSRSLNKVCFKFTALKETVSLVLHFVFFFGDSHSSEAAATLYRKSAYFPQTMSCHSFQRIPGCRDPSTKKLENRNPTQTNLQGPPRKREQMKKHKLRQNEGYGVRAN